MLTTLRRYIGLFSWRTLSLDLMCLPIALSLLMYRPSQWTLGILFIIALGSYFYLYFRQNIMFQAVELRGLLFKIGVLWLIIYLRPTCLSSPLLLQCLWLLLFLVWHLGRYLRNCWRQYQRPKYSNTDCSQMRISALKKEYLRFDRILLGYSFITSMLSVVVLISSLPTSWHWLYSLLVTASIWFIFALELLHISWVKVRLGAEYWIPVLGQDNQPISRVPLTQPNSTLGRMPLVRLIVFAKGMIYLELLDSGLYDTPFISWQYEGETPLNAAQRMIDERFCGVKRAKPHQTLSYSAQYCGQNTLTYLCTVELSEPELLWIDCKPLEGKWWSIDHIDYELLQSCLSSDLAEEYTFLKQTVLLAQRLRERHDVE